MMVSMMLILITVVWVIDVDLDGVIGWNDTVI